MAAFARKKYSGQTGERGTLGSDQQEEPYIVTGASNVADAISAALAAATAAGEDTIIADGIELLQTGVAWEFVAEAADGSAQAYQVTLRYGTNSLTKRDVGTVRISYDTTGGTIHQVIAQTETVYPTSGTPPDFHLVIGNQGDSADGVDVPVPVFNLTVVKVFSKSGLPDPDAVFLLTGKYNDAAFTVTDTVTDESITFLSGECTFLGARHPDPRADGAIEMSYSFTASPNVTNATVGDITGVDKKGSQYAWLRYDKDTSGLATRKVQVLKPSNVVINDVLHSGSFGVLNL